MTTRLTSGLAAAALVGAGLLCPAAASAADPAGYPHDLGFTPTKLITTDDAVYALGIDFTAFGDSGPGYVVEVGGGGEPVQVVGRTGWIDAALEPDGSTLRVIGGDEGLYYFDVDTEDLSVTEVGPAGRVEALGADAVGIYDVANSGGSLSLRIPGTGSVVLDENASAQSTASRTEGETRTWFVAGTEFEESEIATLWRYEDYPESGATSVALGAAGEPDTSVLDLAVDPVDDVEYVLSFSESEGVPQTYGINVVTGETVTYVPLVDTASELALSPDGETLYVGQSAGIVAIDTDEIADYTEDTDVPSTWIDDADQINDLAVDGAGHLFAAADESVYAFTAPAAPANLSATPDAMSTTAISASWDEGKYAWELEGEGEPTRYRYTVRDSHGDVVASDTTVGQVAFVDGLQGGTTYTVEVAAIDGPMSSGTSLTEVTTYDRYVGAPSAIGIQGSLTVGSTLSVAETGAWEEGAAVTYEWYGTLPDAQSSGPVIATGPSLPLTQAHLDMAIFVAVTGTKGGHATVSLVSAPNPMRVANPPVVTPPVVTPPVVTPPTTTTPALSTMKGAKPDIEGKAKVGKTLSVDTGAWTKGAKLTYQWSANGKEIKGADGARLKLTKALKGKRISVEVTGTKAGFTTLTKTSDKTAKVKR